MKKLLFIFSCVLFLNSTGIGSSNLLNGDTYRCWVTLSWNDPQTGQEMTQTWYSDSRTSEADCEAGGEALANGNFMMSSDFRRSYSIAPE